MGRLLQFVFSPPVEQVLLGGVEKGRVLAEAAEGSVAAVAEQAPDFLGRMVVVNVQDAGLRRFSAWRLIADSTLAALGLGHSLELLWCYAVANVQPALTDLLAEARRSLLFLGGLRQKLGIFRAVSLMGPDLASREFFAAVGARLHDASAEARAIFGFSLRMVILVFLGDMRGLSGAGEAGVSSLARKAKIYREVFYRMRILAGRAEPPVWLQKRPLLTPSHQVCLYSAGVKDIPAPLARDWFKHQVLLSYVNSMLSLYVRVKRNILSCCPEGGYPYGLTTH